MTEASDLYGKIAEKYGLTIEQVREAIIFFWRSGVKRSLENMVNNEIYISKLGSFKVKSWKLKYAIPNSKLWAENPNTNERTSEYLNLLNSRLIEVNNLLEEKNKRRLEFLEKNPRSIPEPPPDMGGVEEQADQEGRCGESVRGEDGDLPRV